MCAIVFYYFIKETSNYRRTQEVSSHPDGGHSTSPTTKVKRTAPTSEPIIGMSLLYVNSTPRPKIDDWRLMSRCYFSCYTIYLVKSTINVEGKKIY